MTREPDQTSAGGASGPLRWPARAACAAIRVYQGARAGRPSPCRYWPTCSEYAREAIEGHGLWRGGWLAARRLARCRPLSSHGFDPVPLLPVADEAARSAALGREARP